ncbi:helix-turn-helix transcriptional regulator, partial [archaeon]|nr:helix-turn-helix transcriptional regulator [archaeon]
MLEKLTDRELDVLSCIIHGRSSKKIALLLHISSRTIEWHIKNIMI